MPRSIGFAVLVALGLGGAMLAAPPANAAVIHPAGARAAASDMAGQVTPVRHYGRPHDARYKRPVRSCRVVWKKVWTRYGTRRVKTRVCRVW